MYDEFTEYMIARSWVDSLSGGVEEERLHKLCRLESEAIRSAITFSPAIGALVFLDQMLEADGTIVNNALEAAPAVVDELTMSRPAAILYLLENCRAADLGDVALRAFDTLERRAGEDLKEQVASAILRAFRAKRNDGMLKSIVERILEISDEDAAQMRESDAMMALELSELASEDDTELVTAPMAVLPPARYHYDETTRLSAIALLLASKDVTDYDRVESATQRLGRLSMHSALEALRAVDLAADSLVFKSVEEYVLHGAVEYRLYCVWLLRQRYGREAAAFIIALLEAAETRVHEYAFRVFETRKVEEDLVRVILARIGDESKAPKPWHLRHFVRILAMTGSYENDKIIELLGVGIAEALAKVTKTAAPLLRQDALRAFVRFRRFADRETIDALLTEDLDPCVRERLTQGL
jgi:hypothetical protein